MRAPITQDDVDQLEFNSADHGAAAAQFTAWAEAPHPHDALSPRELLTRAGEELELAEDDDAAMELYRRAADADGDALLDPRSHLISLHLHRGERQAALDLDRELRRSRPEESALYEYLGEVWAEHGDHRRALAWFERGILRHEQGAGFADVDLSMLCLSRWQLRQELGHPPDDYDAIGAGMLVQMEQREDEQLG